MAARGHASFDPVETGGRGVDADVDQVDAEPRNLRVTDLSDVVAPGKRGFEGEVPAILEVLAEGCNGFAPGGDLDMVRCGELLSDGIRVQDGCPVEDVSRLL
jgi:hypothetical protein